MAGVAASGGAKAAVAGAWGGGCVRAARGTGRSVGLMGGGGRGQGTAVACSAAPGGAGAAVEGAGAGGRMGTAGGTGCGVLLAGGG